MITNKQYILTLSCADKSGVVASVSQLLFQHKANIIESQQFRDPIADKFFMRIEFCVGDFKNKANIEALFTPIAEEFAMDFAVYNKDCKPKVVIAVSKDGHCFNHLLHHYFTGNLPIEIVAVVSNHQDLQEMAGWHNIPFYHLPITKETKPQQEVDFFNIVQDKQADVVVLARYMQILSADLCSQLQGRAINIHHSFLPSFKGANPYKQAYERGVKIIGATAHYVTADLDEGQIIEQEIVRVNHSHGSNQLKSIGQDIESQVLTRALKYHIEHRVIINGKKTVVFS